MENRIPLFFAGASSINGYCSHLGEIYKPDGGWRTYIIKGGAGMGKSTMMKKIASELISNGADAWLAPCPGDPDSLDAAVFPGIKACIMDGTAPHVVNPKYPEVCEVIVNLGDQCDHNKMLSHSDEVISAFKQSDLLYQRATRYIAATASLLADNYRVACDCTDMRRAAEYGAQLAMRTLPKKSGRGEEQIRFLSAVTPKGLIFFSDTVETMCDRVFIVEDEYGAASRAIMSAVRITALQLGYDIICCMCPFAPDEKPEHIFVPELGLGFITQNHYLKTDSDERRIHARRFISASALSSHRQRLSFNRRAINELINGTVSTFSQAKALHDSIEKCYIECMDFAAVDQRRKQITDELLSRM